MHDLQTINLRNSTTQDIIREVEKRKNIACLQLMAELKFRSINTDLTAFQFLVQYAPLTQIENN